MNPCHILKYVKVKDNGELSYGFRCRHYPSQRYSTRALRSGAIRAHLAELRKKS